MKLSIKLLGYFTHIVSSASEALPVWNWALWSPSTDMEDGFESIDLFTSLTGIGVKGVNELPTEWKKAKKKVTKYTEDNKKIATYIKA